MSNFVAYPIRTLTLVKDYEVLVHFRNGDVKMYDFWPIIVDSDIMLPLMKDYELFKNFSLDPGGYGVIWNDDIDIAAEELWYNGEDVESPFANLMSFRDAEECWDLKPSALRKAVQYGRFAVGTDVMNFGKQWVITRQAMEREYGIHPHR